MKRCVRTMETQEEFRQKVRNSSNQKTWIFRQVCALFFFAVLIFISVNIRVRCNDRIAQMNKEIEVLKREIHAQELSIENLRLRKENLTSLPHINACNHKFAMNLRPAEARQIRRVTLIRTKGAEEYLSAEAFEESTQVHRTAAISRKK